MKDSRHITDVHFIIIYQEAQFKIKRVDQIRNKVAEIVQKINALEETIKNAKFPKDESYYRGEKKYGLKDGIGSMRTPKGDYYVGQWKRGLRHGLGKLILKEEGETYLCEWKFDNPHGLGEMTTKEGKKYQGEFKLAVPDGFGIKTWPDGSTYKGWFKEGLLDGFGIFENAETIHSGYWSKGKRQGLGRVVRKKDRHVLYEGPFDNNKPAGRM